MRKIALIVSTFILLLSLGFENSIFAQSLLITEIQARNDSTLADEDGEFSDWFEVFNSGPTEIDLEGLGVTDDSSEPHKWRFPAVSLEAGGFLVVFASGKDLREPGQELHTNFQLSGDGEYLGLYSADGSTVISEYDPFESHADDESFGIAIAGESFVLFNEGVSARWRVPFAPNQRPSDWATLSFNDTSWQVGSAGFGFDVQGGGGGLAAENVAIGKPTSQSSTGFGFGPGNAVDGDLGNFTHTDAGENLPSTWEVDLEENFQIESVVIHNRDNCCTSRLRDITVSIIDNDDEVVFVSELLNEENELGGGGTSGPDELSLNLVALTGNPVLGRYVRVVRTPDPDLSGTGGTGNDDEADVLQMGEVQVFAAPPPETYNELISTDLSALMPGVTSSALIRIPFTVDPGLVLDQLVLRMQYDDGFVAYLNGTQVASRNAPGGLAWNSSATQERDDAQAVQFEAIDISAHLGSLLEGDNVLAIQGLNLNSSDDDFLIAASLRGQATVSSVTRHFLTPTPGEVNSDDFFNQVADTEFSIDRGFYDNPIGVEITSDTPDAQIRYTTDGTWPTESHGTLYTDSIQISQTTVLRAIAYRPGDRSSNVDTHTYIFLDDIIVQDYNATLARGFPASWGGTSADYGMDPDVIGQNGSDDYGGKYTAIIKDSLLAVPTISIVLPTNDLFAGNGIYTNSGSRGISWERAASFEVIHPDGTRGTQENCGLRLQGGAFRSHGLTKKHSLRVLFKEIYGDTKLRYPLLQEGSTERFDTLTLRANSNDGWQWSAAGDKPLYIRDSFGRQSHLDQGGVSSHETFCHVYLNGVYWGLYNPVERPDHSFGATYFGGDKENWDAISNRSASQGSMTAWNEMINLGRQGLGNHANYMRIQGRNPDGSPNPNLPHYLDVPNMIEYMICNLYLGNSDWPHKNYWVGRDRSSESTGFKFYMWDSEWSLDLRSGLNQNRVNVDNVAAEPYALCRPNLEFRMEFADRLHKAFSRGGTYYVDPSNKNWDTDHPERNRPAARFVELAEQIELAVVAESARWGDQHNSTPYTRDEHWARERDDLLANYFPRRSEIVLSQFQSAGLYPNISVPEFNVQDGYFDTETHLFISSGNGTIYYTTNGEDPRLEGGDVHPTAEALAGDIITVVVDQGDQVKFLVPDAGDAGLETDWTEVGFNDGSWLNRTTGVGYEEGSGYEDELGQDDSNLLYQTQSSLYFRISFDVDDPQFFTGMRLLMKYDDGFIAYLNGEKVAAMNDPDNPQWNSSATNSNSDSNATSFELFDISNFLDLLNDGENVLAIHGLNSSSNSSDFLIAPRLELTEAVDPSAIVLESGLNVKSRSLNGNDWSALNESTFYHVSHLDLRISEVHYHPRPSESGSFAPSEYEFIEFINTSDRVIDLTAYHLSGGIEFDFQDSLVDTLNPGQRVVLVENLEAFEQRYNGGAGILIAGEYSGRLSNGSEQLILEAPHEQVILDFSYSDSWFPATDGQGPSLTIVDELADPDSWFHPTSWRASSCIDGTPGLSDSECGDGGLQRPGDSNQDGHLDVGDAISLLLRIYRGKTDQLPCPEDAPTEGNNLLIFDINGDDTLDNTDVVSLLTFLYLDGEPPAAGTDCLFLEGCENVCSF